MKREGVDTLKDEPTLWSEKNPPQNLYIFWYSLLLIGIINKSFRLNSQKIIQGFKSKNEGIKTLIFSK
jgi:hypothetical protein